MSDLKTENNDAVDVIDEILSIFSTTETTDNITTETATTEEANDDVEAEETRKPYIPPKDRIPSELKD